MPAQVPGGDYSTTRPDEGPRSFFQLGSPTTRAVRSRDPEVEERPAAYRAATPESKASEHRQGRKRDDEGTQTFATSEPNSSSSSSSSLGRSPIASSIGALPMSTCMSADFTLSRIF